MSFSPYLTGLFTGLSLIMAIGAQNAFVLRQGLRGQHVLLTCLTCALSDAILIVLGVTSFSQISQWLPWLDPVMRYFGAGFLIWYGFKSLRAALTSNDSLTTSQDQSPKAARQTLLACLAITWLNPHVYLDTVVLLGTISTRFEGQTTAFALGAISGSFMFFFALGYGAAWLRPLFANPRAWRILEAAIALIMWAIAVKLLWP